MINRKIIFYPIIFSIFPALALYVRNNNLIQFTEVLTIIIPILVVLSVLWWVINKLIGNLQKSALIVSIFFILFFSFGHTLPAFGGLISRITGSNFLSLLFNQLDRNLYILLTLWILLFGGLIFIIHKTKSELILVTLFLNISSIILLLLMLYQSISTSTSSHRILDNFLQLKGTNLENNFDKNEAQINSFEGKHPDIYYIVLDAYGREDILNKYYGFDNQTFLDELINHGFYIADQSNSNYAFTLLSLSSSLNMMQIDELQNIVGTSSNNLSPVISLIQSNKLSNMLSKFGYATVGFETGYHGTELDDFDYYLSPPIPLTAYQNELINLTPARIWLRNYQLKKHIDRILYTLEQLPKTKRSDQPTFIFAHIVSPRQPFVFTGSGERTYFDNSDYSINIDNFPFASSQDVYIEGYTNQVTSLNKLLSEIIDTILKQAGDESIIIIQGDHGPRSMINWSSVEESNIHERMSILNAYYFPDQDYSNLYPGITPVNTFRIILDQYFGLNLGTVEDNIYFSLLNSPYGFINVTEILNDPK